MPYLAMLENSLTKLDADPNVDDFQKLAASMSKGTSVALEDPICGFTRSY